MSEPFNSNTAAEEGGESCRVGECVSCGATVLVTDDEESDSFSRYGSREFCKCGGTSFRGISVDEALK